MHTAHKALGARYEDNIKCAFDMQQMDTECGEGDKKTGNTLSEEQEFHGRGWSWGSECKRAVRCGAVVSDSQAARQ